MNRSGGGDAALAGTSLPCRAQPCPVLPPKIDSRSPARCRAARVRSPGGRAEYHACVIDTADARLLLPIVGALGLAVGSFLNVVIYRVPRGESLSTPASHCPSCGAPIRARPNIPVLGWLML